MWLRGEVHILIKLSAVGGHSREWAVPFLGIAVLNCVQIEKAKLSSRPNCMCSFLSLLGALDMIGRAVFNSCSFDFPAGLGHSLE